MRIMGLDYGTKTVGVAISDALGLTAQGIETIQRKEENKLRRTLARIEELVREYEVDTIVLGFPKHMNNDVGERAKMSSAARCCPLCSARVCKIESLWLVTFQPFSLSFSLSIPCTFSCSTVILHVPCGKVIF